MMILRIRAISSISDGFACILMLFETLLLATLFLFHLPYSKELSAALFSKESAVGTVEPTVSEKYSDSCS